MKIHIETAKYDPNVKLLITTKEMEWTRVWYIFCKEQIVIILGLHFIWLNSIIQVHSYGEKATVDNYK